MSEPDFEALRAKRNEEVRRVMREIAVDMGWNPEDVKCTHNDNACYCACPDGPCEHKWDGKPYESEDGCAWSATCSRCGCTAMNHDLRCAP